MVARRKVITINDKKLMGRKKQITNSSRGGKGGDGWGVAILDAREAPWDEDGPAVLPCSRQRVPPRQRKTPSWVRFVLAVALSGPLF